MIVSILQILSMLVNVLVMFIIIQFVISLLFAFNVVDSNNQFLWQIYRSINGLLDPILNPIRKILPSTGAIDFSPLVLILALNALIIILQNALL